MSYARKYDQFRERDAELTAICVDTPAQNRAMIEKLLLPFKVLSDPDGEAAIKHYGVWDEEGQIAIPSIVVIGKDGAIRYFYSGKDFADRPGDEEVFAALDHSRTGG